MKFVEINRRDSFVSRFLFLRFQVVCIEAAQELSLKLKVEDDKPMEKTYMTLEEIMKILKDQGEKEKVFPKRQPKRFTVHASSDPSKEFFLLFSKFDVVFSR